MTPLRRTARLALAALTAAALAGVLGTNAKAAYVGPAGTTGCPSMTLTTAFQKWGDTGSYFLGPGGAFEGTLTGWTAAGGAALVTGNETFYVHSTKDKYAVALPSGSSITSPSICVTNQTPDLRFFLRNTGSSSAALNVNMTYSNAAGQPSTVTVATLTGTSKWAPSPAVLFLANITPLVNGSGLTWVTFSFAPVGTTGQWQVDDFYVDPMKHH
jgi:hypothetical protein